MLVSKSDIISNLGAKMQMRSISTFRKVDGNKKGLFQMLTRPSLSEPNLRGIQVGPGQGQEEETRGGHTDHSTQLLGSATLSRSADRPAAPPRLKAKNAVSSVQLCLCTLVFISLVNKPENSRRFLLSYLLVHKIKLTMTCWWETS
jgi:hypothetical protein